MAPLLAKVKVVENQHCFKKNHSGISHNFWFETLHFACFAIFLVLLNPDLSPKWFIFVLIILTLTAFSVNLFQDS